METATQENLISLNVDYDAGNALKETVKWTRFISIFGMVFLVLFALGMAFAGAMLMGTFAKFFPLLEAFAGVFVFIAIFFILIFGFFIYLLYRFSTQVKRGIELQDQALFNSGLNSLKIYFIISGVLAILSLLGNISQLF